MCGYSSDCLPYIKEVTVCSLIMLLIYDSYFRDEGDAAEKAVYSLECDNWPLHNRAESNTTALWTSK